jgi:hypothetical protein
MSHDEERAAGVRLKQKRDRAPRHWLDPLVELSRYAAKPIPRSGVRWHRRIAAWADLIIMAGDEKH